MKSALTEQSYQSLKVPGWLNNAFMSLMNFIGYKVGDSKNIGDVILFHGKLATAGANLQFFNPVATTEVGNLPTGLRNDGEPMQITAIRILSGVNASIKVTDWVPGLTTAELQNGTFQIQINGSNVTNQIPLTVANGDGTSTDQLGYYAFAKPINLPAQQTLFVNLVFATTPAVANTNVFVELYGIGALS
jgi:hypothetical protein